MTDDDDDDAAPAPAHIAALERAAAAVLIDEDASDAATDAGVAATRELARLMEADDRDACFALFRLVCLREELQATRRRPRRRMRR